MRDKSNNLSLWRRFSGELETLKECVRDCADCGELLAFLENKSALSGDVKRQPMDAICNQIDMLEMSLGEELFSFAKCIIALAKRDIMSA